MGFSPGEESRPGAVASQAIEAQPSFGQIKPGRGRVVRGSNNVLGKDVVDVGYQASSVEQSGRRGGKLGAQDGRRRASASRTKDCTIERGWHYRPRGGR